jgi:hypothetical protein
MEETNVSHVSLQTGGKAFMLFGHDVDDARSMLARDEEQEYECAYLNPVLLFELLLADVLLTSDKTGKVVVVVDDDGIEAFDLSEHSLASCGQNDAKCMPLTFS